MQGGRARAARGVLGARALQGRTQAARAKPEARPRPRLSPPLPLLRPEPPPARLTGDQARAEVDGRAKGPDVRVHAAAHAVPRLQHHYVHAVALRGPKAGAAGVAAAVVLRRGGSPGRADEWRGGINGMCSCAVRCSCDRGAPPAGARPRPVAAPASARVPPPAPTLSTLAAARPDGPAPTTITRPPGGRRSFGFSGSRSRSLPRSRDFDRSLAALGDFVSYPRGSNVSLLSRLLMKWTTCGARRMRARASKVAARARGCGRRRRCGLTC
jgi:hypothetical protein